MAYKVFRWLGWSVLISIVPFIGLAIIRGLLLQKWPGFAPIIGSGQLLLTSVALVAGGIKELSGMDAELRTRRRDTAMFSLLIFALLMAMVYGFLANETLRGSNSVNVDTISAVSGIFFALSFVTTALAVAISTPADKEGH